jgi:hypothetical protein
MPSSRPAAVLLFAAAMFPVGVEAQTTDSFEALQAVLEPGQQVVVTDDTGRDGNHQDRFSLGLTIISGSVAVGWLRHGWAGALASILRGGMRDGCAPPSRLRGYGETDFAGVTGLACLDEARPQGERSLAGSTGLEPAASGVTGRRSNQLNYDPESNNEIADLRLQISD